MYKYATRKSSRGGEEKPESQGECGRMAAMTKGQQCSQRKVIVLKGIQVHDVRHTVDEG